MKSLVAIVFCALGYAAAAQGTSPASMNKAASQQSGQAPPATVQGTVLSMDKLIPQNTSPVLPAADTTGQVSMKKYFLREVTPQLHTEQ